MFTCWLIVHFSTINYAHLFSPNLICLSLPNIFVSFTILLCSCSDYAYSFKSSTQNWLVIVLCVVSSLYPRLVGLIFLRAGFTYLSVSQLLGRSYILSPSITSCEKVHIFRFWKFRLKEFLFNCIKKNNEKMEIPILHERH